MDLMLKGKKAVLAGASKGIGRAVARLLAQEGCNVALCARDPDGVQEAVEELQQQGVTAIGHSVDMADATAYRQWVQDAAEALGGCDIFICFGSAGGGPASEERWQSAFTLDLMATWHGLEAALPYLEHSDAAAVVVISTTVAIEPAFGAQPYAAIKAAAANYAGGIAQAYAARGIRVNTVSPGPIMIEGGVWDRIREGRREFYDRTCSQIPMGRLGTADEVARGIAFLVSPVSAFTTGTNLVIDGGFTKRVQH